LLIVLLAHSIIFIHGMTWDQERTWTAPGQENRWPKDILPKKLDKARVLAYGYDAYVVDWKDVVSTNRLNNHAQNLLNAFVCYREETGTVSYI
jgi:protein SERAC1